METRRHRIQLPIECMFNDSKSIKSIAHAITSVRLNDPSSFEVCRMHEWNALILIAAQNPVFYSNWSDTTVSTSKGHFYCSDCGFTKKRNWIKQNWFTSGGDEDASLRWAIRRSNNIIILEGNRHYFSRRLWLSRAAHSTHMCVSNQISAQNMRSTSIWCFNLRTCFFARPTRRSLSQALQVSVDYQIVDSLKKHVNNIISKIIASAGIWLDRGRCANFAVRRDWTLEALIQIRYLSMATQLTALSRSTWNSIFNLKKPK